VVWCIFGSTNSLKQDVLGSLSNTDQQSDTREFIELNFVLDESV